MKNLEDFSEEINWISQPNLYQKKFLANWIGLTGHIV
jgi:hypothetical protein